MKTSFAALAGFVLAFVFLTGSGFQATATAPSWPPPAKAMVHICGENFSDLEVGQEAVLYDVPTDAHLVLTGIGTPNPNGATWELAERLGGMDRALWSDLTLGAEPGVFMIESATWDTPGPVGIPLRPGSQLVLKHTGPGGAETVEMRFARFTGYLTP